MRLFGLCVGLNSDGGGVPFKTCSAGGKKKKSKPNTDGISAGVQILVSGALLSSVGSVPGQARCAPCAARALGQGPSQRRLRERALPPSGQRRAPRRATGMATDEFKRQQTPIPLPRPPPDTVLVSRGGEGCCLGCPPSGGIFRDLPLYQVRDRLCHLLLYLPIK